MKIFYKHNIQSIQADITFLKKKINSNSLFRLAVILIGAAWLFQVFQWNDVWVLMFSVFVIIVVFAYLVRRQSILEKKLDSRQSDLRVNQNELNLIEGMENMYDDGAQFDDPKHPYVSDLDVFGTYSLFGKLNRAATMEGVTCLANWLLSASAKEVIEKRQASSEELASKTEWCQDFQSKLLFNLHKKTTVSSFLTSYLRDGALRFGSGFMRVYVRLAPFILLVGVLISLWGFPIWGYVGLLCLIHLFWALGLSGKVSFFSNRIDKVGQTLIAYADAVKMVEGETFSSELALSLQKRLQTDSGEPLSIAFQRLGQLIDKLDARNNILVGAVLNMLFLWDFKQVLAIVDWKKDFEGDILESFEIIAEFEALMSLATLRRNHHDWCQPVLSDSVSEGRIIAGSINHPLIVSEKAVSNDYDARDHQIALITGSNMAGKSTFLRTVGINAVLAYAGAVVCAREFSLPIYRLISYMRIKDDLKESTSTFKAEIDRMKFILGIVEVTEDSFFLIDEMLRGTNSVDKYLGSKAIIKKLIDLNGKGMVATHDLQLASLEEDFSFYIKNFHFDIQVLDGEMLFDYKLKTGKCTVFNASMLLKGIGIDVDKE
ncbi:MAG TPA: DNA mismatch repair protein MutS [Sphingobacterium sp.]|nr:DNA mismatch repair protein MutS [Sphingobacterium sp.]